VDISKKILQSSDTVIQNFVVLLDSRQLSGLIIYDYIDDEARECIFRNFSRIAKHMLKEDILYWKETVNKNYKQFEELLKKYPDSKNNGCIFIADLVNSAAKINILGDENYYEDILLKYNTILSESINENDGRVIKNIGNTYLAVFHDNFFAMKCCIEAQDKFNEINKKRDMEDRISVKMVLHNGEYRFKRLETNNIDIYGSSINYAAIMIENAKKDQISVSRAFLDQWNRIDYNHLIEEINQDSQNVGYHLVLDKEINPNPPNIDNLLEIVKLEQKIYNNITFNSLGSFNFSGFEDKQELFNVIIKDS
jgi:class 3 adenylate cyclase